MISSIRAILGLRPLAASPTERRLRTAADVSDLRRLARRRLPRGVFDYIDGGAESESTMRHNRAAFADRDLRARVLRDVSSIDPSCRVLGREQPSPIALAPTGFTRIADPEGELAVARAASAAGLPYTLSTLATRSIEEVARAAPTGHHWFQVYVWRDRGLVFELIDRAHASGYEALMVTVDTPVFGRRLRDVRRGFQLPPTIGPATIADGLAHPTWTWRLLRSEPIDFANVRGRSVGDGSTPVSLAEYINGQFDPSFGWDDIAELRSRWRGPLVLKGIQTDEDALLARDVGADAVVVSNHGGRQLDGAPATLEMLPPIKEAIGDELEVFLDGGIRRGSDIVKALALGANMCLIGRAYLYGLATAGQAGVGHVLALLDADVRRTLALMGLTSLEQLTPEMVLRR